MPAAAVIPALRVYIYIVAVKKFVVESTRFDQGASFGQEMCVWKPRWLTGNAASKRLGSPVSSDIE